jgi:hypothetical protein
LQKNFKKENLSLLLSFSKFIGKGCSRRERALIREKYQEEKTV